MTAGYRETDDGSATDPTRPVGRPGPLPPRTEPMRPDPGYAGQSAGSGWPPAAPAPAYPTSGYSTSGYPTSGYPTIPAQAQPEPAGYPGYPVNPPTSAAPHSAAPHSAAPHSGAPLSGAPQYADPSPYAGAPHSGAPLSAAPTSGYGPAAPTSGYAPAGYPPEMAPPGSLAPAGYPPPGPAPARRSPALAILVVVLFLFVIGQTVGLVVLNNKADKAARADRAGQAADAKHLADLDARVKELEKQAAASLDPEAVAAAVLPSVFKVVAGNFSGTAFVVKADDTGTSLITNYHVVADLYESAGRTVRLEHDNQSFSARIVKVNPDDDVALLESEDKFPALTVDAGEVTTGEPVVVVGAPLGLAQSVTTGVVSAIRNDIPGEGGRTYIQFSAPINPGNSGGPVVNAQKQVVGIATAKARDAEGIGLAIPISVACKDLSIC